MNETVNIEPAKVGDVVRLNSGGPKMSVLSVNDGIAHVAHIHEGIMRKAKLPTQCLDVMYPYPELVKQEAKP